MIDGVEEKILEKHHDERGFFAEIIRGSDHFFNHAFAQLSFSHSFTGVTKAWHLHKEQTDWICPLNGDIKLVLYDLRQDSKTANNIMEYLIGETMGLKVIKIPPGIAHGYKIINGPATICYIMDREYNPDDEYRIPHDDKEIGYDWIKGPEIQ